MYKRQIDLMDYSPLGVKKETPRNGTSYSVIPRSTQEIIDFVIETMDGTLGGEYENSE